VLTTQAAVLTQSNPPSWGLDRIDQRRRPMDSNYSFPNYGGAGVGAYVIDTGIRATHVEFGGCASMAKSYYAANTDDFGHGTHVAGILGGGSTGVAKNVTLLGIKAADRKGAALNSDVIDAISWVVGRAKGGGRNRSIILMSIGAGQSAALNAAGGAAWAAGVISVVAAGNSADDARFYSPASAASAVTVGSTTSGDARSPFSNYGPAVDIHAPGSAIYSAYYRSDADYVTLSGTSAAAPHVAGFLASLWSANLAWTPAELVKKMVSLSTKRAISGMGGRTPNRLLYTRF
jgi:serine protease